MSAGYTQAFAINDQIDSAVEELIKAATIEHQNVTNGYEILQSLNMLRTIETHCESHRKIIMNRMRREG